MQVWLEVEVPICGLRPSEARDFQETLPVPPPSTVAGMLLSLLGVEMEEASRFAGNRIGLRVRPAGPTSTILRKMRRDPKSGGDRKGIPQFRPEYQELLVDLRFWVLLDDGAMAPGAESLPAALQKALDDPGTVRRYGALSLGESAFMVDSVRVVDEPPIGSLGLRRNDSGRLRLSLWVDRKEPKRYRWGRFDLDASVLTSTDLTEAFTPAQAEPMGA